MNAVQTEASDVSDNSKDEADSQAAYAKKPFHKDKKGQANVSEEKPKNGEVEENEGFSSDN